MKIKILRYTVVFKHLPISADSIRFPERQKVTATTASEDSNTDSACGANSTQLPNFGKISHSLLDLMVSYSVNQTIKL